MDETQIQTAQTAQQPPVQPVPTGLRVRSGLAAGWECTACAGTANGRQLFRANCSYCQE